MPSRWQRRWNSDERALSLVAAIFGNSGPMVGNCSRIASMRSLMAICARSPVFIRKYVRLRVGQSIFSAVSAAASLCDEPISHNNW